MSGAVLRKVWAWPFRLLLAGVYRAGFRAWQLTLISLGLNVWAGVLILSGDRLVPGIVLLFAGAFDVLDGTVARLRGEESRLGAFLDSGLDRVSDAIVFGCLFWSLSGQGQGSAAALSLAAMSVSLGVSHVRAAAEARGVALGEGLFQRLERYASLILGLWIPGALLPVLVILVGLGGVTLLQRVWSGARQLLAVRSQPA
jgi:CDP-diacylglycerol--glycerol-3-phosphate 3-phosphatidyltransferase